MLMDCFTCLLHARHPSALLDEHASGLAIWIAPAGDMAPESSKMLTGTQTDGAVSAVADTGHISMPGAGYVSCPEADAHANACPLTPSERGRG